MIYRCKVGTEDLYNIITGSSIVKVIAIADEQIKENPNLKILEIRDSKNKLIDLDKYRRRIHRAKRADTEGYMNKTDLAKCYRSVQQMMWYKYDEEEYAKIKVDLKKIKDSSKSLEEFKCNIANYIEMINNK